MRHCTNLQSRYFTFKIPDNIESEIAAPMMCAGITVYSPLVRLGAGPGKKVAISGVGGLGHFAVMFAKALGAEVYVLSTSPDKKEDVMKMGESRNNRFIVNTKAKRCPGADHFVDVNKEGWYVTPRVKGFL